MNDKEKLILKINKLLKLAANNPNTAESQAAQAKAFKLMTENGILLNEVIMPGTEADQRQQYTYSEDYAAHQAYNEGAYAHYNEQPQETYQPEPQAQAGKQSAPPVRYLFYAVIILLICGIGYRYADTLMDILIVIAILLFIRYIHVVACCGFIYLIYRLVAG